MTRHLAAVALRPAGVAPWWGHAQRTAKLMVFKLVMAASKTWRRLDGPNQLPKVMLGAKFRDGSEVATPTNRQPEAAA